MTVTGRVLRPDGSPAAGVPVDIVATPRVPTEGHAGPREAFAVLGGGLAGGDGRFRIEASRTSSSRFNGVYALAGSAGPGTAFGYAEIHPDAEPPEADVHLPPDQVIRGRLVDINGQPAAGVAVRFDSAFESPAWPSFGFDSRNLVHPWELTISFEGLRAWPKAVTTDGQGRFALAGVGRGLSAWLSVHDPRFAQYRLVVEGRDRDAGKEVSAALPPPTVIEGRVLAADTGRPVPDAVVAVLASATQFGTLLTTRCRADGQGRFRINPSPGGYFRLEAIAPEGQPYLTAEAEFAWSKAAVRKEVNLTLTRGVSIHGKVTEQGTGRPVPGAAVHAIGRRPTGGWYRDDVTTREDGSFALAAPPGKGHLLVLGPTLDYIPREIAGGALYPYRSPAGGLRHYAHDIIPYDVRAREASHEINPTLRRGQTVRGRVVGPAGEAVADAVVLARNQIDDNPFRRFLWKGETPVRARNGRFELAGLDPEKPMPAYFLDAEHEWGAAVELSGRRVGEEPTIRLQPCGRAKARFVGPNGRPIAGLKTTYYFFLLMTPGAAHGSIVNQGDQLGADQAYLPTVDLKHYPFPDARRTDADGRIELPDLIPGALYRISDSSTANDPEGVQLRKDFTVKPGETVDLGNILVEHPEEGQN
jgi:hypothetical protein